MEQGAVPSVKALAANHALKEDVSRCAKALTEVLLASDQAAADKKRRDFSESVRTSVLKAADHHVKAKQLRSANEMTSMDSAAASAPEAESVDDMVARRKSLLSAGFATEAEKIQTQLAALRMSSEEEQQEIEQRLFKQHLWALESSQKVARDKLAKTQAAETQAAESGWREEIDALTATQASAVQDFQLRVTRAAALEDVDLPTQLLKHRYKPSPDLVAISESLSKMPDDLTLANEAVRETKRRLLAKHQESSPYMHIHAPPQCGRCVRRSGGC